MSRRPRSLPAPPETVSSEPEKIRVLRAELRCYLCGETCGVLWAPPRAQHAACRPVSGRRRLTSSHACLECSALSSLQFRILVSG